MIEYDLQNDYINGLCDIGGKIYVVGGANRNYLYNCFNGTNYAIKDFDYLVCNLEPDIIIQTLKQFGSVKEVGQAFSVILFTPRTDVCNIEFALPRTEVSTGPGYKDFIITPDPYLSLEEDFSRRDATINAIGFRIYGLNDLNKLNCKLNPTPDLDTFTDSFNGVDDIKNKIWRAIGDPHKRFLEDPTRIMRAFRQAGELKLTIDKVTYDAISVHYSVMSVLIPQSNVRLYNELLKLVKVVGGEHLLNDMSKLGILDFLGIAHKEFQADIERTTNPTLKFALMVRPDLVPISQPIKKWIYDKQISATNYFTQSDVNVFIAIQMFSLNVALALGYNCCIDRAEQKYSLLKIREKIYKFAKTESTCVLQLVITYVKIIMIIPKDENEDVGDMWYDNYPMSTDQLTLNGDMIMDRWKIEGKNIGKLKEKLINEIFSDNLKNEKDQLIDHVNSLVKINYQNIF